MTRKGRVDPRIADSRVMKSSGNVFADLGFDEAEASVLAMRAELMLELRNEIERQRLTQAEAAKILHVTQPRVSALKQGKYADFSLDTLVTFAARLGKPARVVVAARKSKSAGKERGVQRQSAIL